MTLADLRRLAVRQRSRIHFQLENGMECVIDEHGIARVPELHSIPEFNLEQELTKAAEFALEPAAVDRKVVPPVRKLERDALAAMVAASAPGAGAHAEHDDE